MRKAASLVTALLASTTTLACTREIPPPVPPMPQAPTNVEQRVSAAKPGTTRILIDANGERAVVKDVVGEADAAATAFSGGSSATVTSHATSRTPVCLAPCYADLPPGLHVLEFTSETDPTRTSTANIQVNDSPKVVRHSIGRSKPASFGLTLLGETFVIGGGAIAFGGLSMLPLEGTKDNAPGFIIGGLAAVLLGLPMWYAGAAQHQPGSTTEIAAR